MKVSVIGAVETAALTIQLLYKHRFEIVGILGHEPKYQTEISGWYDLKRLSETLKLNYQSFVRINDPVNLNWMRSKNPDIIFAVGFSQLLSEEWFAIPKLGCIGFHPTRLPRGRGRAPLAWIILEERNGSATFFLMGKGTDDGPIFIHEPFVITAQDDAGTVKTKINEAMIIALDKWLPRLKNGVWDPIPQDEHLASYYGKRSPEDGLINWHNSAEEIDRLIKASSRPYPGAYTYYNNEKLIIWKSSRENNIKIRGVIGRILIKNNLGHMLVQCGDGLVWIKEVSYSNSKMPVVGSKLGYNTEDEIYNIWKELKKLKNE